MSATETVASPGGLPELTWMRQQLKNQVILSALVPLIVAGLLLLAFPRGFRDPARGEWLGLMFWLLALAVWVSRRLHGLAASWGLVLGCLGLDLLALVWGGMSSAVYLLALPAALATVSVSVAAGATVAGCCTVLLLVAPPSLLPSDPALRVVTLIGLWSTFGLAWLTLRPLLTALQWSWSSYERSRQLLERSRDYQGQLKQTLKDLSDANLQLSRLNQLTQALRREADEARQAKEQFVANVSHELRTPLNMVIGFTELITETPEAYGDRIPRALLADLAVILRNSQHLSSLIDDVLDLSQMEARRMALTKERAKLSEIVQAATIAVRPLFDSKGLYLRSEVPEGLIITCDRTRIREVILNLLSNAGRFTEKGGVNVRAWRDKGDVVVSVADTGPGIALEDQGKLFQPFRQLDGSVHRRYGGTGLGLAISRSFVELHGGRMSVKSEEGAGTTLFFRLPIEPPLPVAAGVARWLHPEWEHVGRTQRPLAPVRIARPRLVVVDPDGPLARLLTRYLRDADIVTMADQQEALLELERTPAQALLINHTSIPQGLQDYNESGSLPAHIPAVICSIPGVPDAADALGVSDYLVKPISREQLLAALKRLNLRGNTVLVVDDEPEALRLFWRMLASSDADYRVLTASSGEEALSLLRGDEPDVVLLDLVMPRMDGFRLLEVRSQDPRLADIPVVVTSARDPSGQPILSNALAVTQAGGLATHEVLACIDAILRSLARGYQPGDLARPESPPD